VKTPTKMSDNVVRKKSKGKVRPPLDIAPSNLVAATKFFNNRERAWLTREVLKSKFWKRLEEYASGENLAPRREEADEASHKASGS
jgi:hypothetical protein